KSQVLPHPKGVRHFRQCCYDKILTSRMHEGNGSLWNIQYFQPVGNQQPRTEKFPYAFTVCISVMYDYMNVLGLVQTMEMFKLLGVQKIGIYKTSCYPDMQKVLNYYVRQSFVHIIPWTVSSYIEVARGWKKSDSPGELHYTGQIAALNDCVYRYMYENQYVALQDLDELILPLKEDNWTTLIPQLEKIYQHHAGFEFENNVFPISLSRNKTPENTPDLWKQFEGENLLPHVYRIPNDPNVFNNFKVIVNPRLVFKATVHGLLHSKGVLSGYLSKYFSQQSILNDTRLWDYADKLIPAVSEVLRQFVKSN
uniref:Glycosyltransferase family 92 protein n=1 Tax=Pygocentrus nattereri TaxID=42514 RepID=A0A3B4EPT6_PYGNA